MSVTSETSPTPDNNLLLDELGSLGMAKLAVAEPVAGQTTITASVPYEQADFFLGYGRKGYPFAYGVGKVEPIEGEWLAVTKEWDPSMVATDRTWDILTRLNVVAMKGEHDLPTLQPDRTVHNGFDHLFTDSSEDQADAEQLREAIAGIHEYRPTFLTVEHAGGLAHGHVVIADGFEGQNRGYAVTQSGKFHQAGTYKGRHHYAELPSDMPALYWSRDHWERLRTIGELTFNRMATNSVAVVELTHPE